MRPEWDVYCVVCGGPPAHDSSLSATGRNLSAPVSTDWLSDWVGVAPEQPDQPIALYGYNHGCFEAKHGTRWVRFATFERWSSLIQPARERHDELHGPPGECDCSDLAAAAAAEVEDEDYDEDWDSLKHAPCPATAPEPGLHYFLRAWTGEDGWARYGVAFHRACGEVLEQQLQYKLNFNHIWPMLQQQAEKHGWTNHLRQLDYGGNQQYHGARFMFGAVAAADEYLLLDPRLCSSNADRIVREWRPLVRKWQGRPARSPSTPQQGAAAGKGSTKGGSTKAGNSKGSKGGSKGGSSKSGSAAAANDTSALALSLTTSTAARQTRGAAARMRAQSRANASATLLQLIVSNAASNQQQLQLAAQLLPVCSTMPSSLSGTVQLVVAANTAPRAAQFARWLTKCGSVLQSLELDAAVDCCVMDARQSTKAITDAMNAAVATNKALRLTSFKGHVNSSSDADSLLRSLPLQHTTSLSLGGVWRLSAAGAEALAAATALRELSLPGAGLAASLTAARAPSLTASLQRLSLTDAGCCSAADLTALSQHLTALTELQLTYHPTDPGAAAAACAISDDRIITAVHECWPQLPALRSLQLGPRKVSYQDTKGDIVTIENDYEDAYQPVSHPRLCIEGDVLASVAALTSLTSLCLGPSADLVRQDDEFGYDSGLGLLQSPLEALTGLRRLDLTLVVDGDEDDSNAEEYRPGVMAAVAALPELQELVVFQDVCGVHVAELPGARQLTRLHIVTTDLLLWDLHSVVPQLRKANPGLEVLYTT